MSSSHEGSRLPPHRTLSGTQTTFPSEDKSRGYYEDESMAQEDAAAYAAAEKAASDKEPFSSFGSSVDSE